jgi:hypothetical protein
MISYPRNTVLVLQRLQAAVMNSLLPGHPKSPLTPCLRLKLLRAAPAAGIKRIMDSPKVLLAGHLPGPTMCPACRANEGMKAAIPEILQLHPRRNARLSNLRSRRGLCLRRGLARSLLARSQKNGLMRSPLVLYLRRVVLYLRRVVLYLRKDPKSSPLTGMSTHREAAGRKNLLLIQDQNVRITAEPRHSLPVSLYENRQLDVMTAVMVAMIVGMIVAPAMTIPRAHVNFILGARSLLFCRMNEILNRSWRRSMRLAVPERRFVGLRSPYPSLFLSLFLMGQLHHQKSLQA